MTTISIWVFHESWFTKPFSDGFWDIETSVKKCFWKYWRRGEGRSLLYQNIKVLKRKKKCLEYLSEYAPRDVCNILLQSVQIWQPWMRFQGSSPVLSTPDIVLIRNKAAAGRSGQEQENELYLPLKLSWIFVSIALEDCIACAFIWKFKVDPFQATMVPNGVYVPLF